MLCDSTETALRMRCERAANALRMRCECAETALRIDSQWSRRQIRQSVRAALVGTVVTRGLTAFFSLVSIVRIFIVFQFKYCNSVLWFTIFGVQSKLIIFRKPITDDALLE